MALFNKNKSGGIADVIRCDEASYLIWKWHPAGSQAGNNRKENAIRFGSSLRAKNGEVAVFVHSDASGIVQDFIEGPFDGLLATANLPAISSIIGLAYDGGSPFQAEVYFINLARIIQVKFGVPFFDVFDPRFLDFGVPTAVRGTISFRISNYREFIKLHRLQSFSLNDFQTEIRDATSRYVKDAVANAPAANNIPVVQLESKMAQINDIIEYDIVTRLKEDFGVEVSAVDISAIEVDKDTDGYRQLKVVTQDVSTASVQAHAAVSIKEMQDKQRIEAENYEKSLRIQRDEAQYAQRKQTQSANFAAFQVESQTAVGVAGAEALGQMGSDGGDDMSGGGFNPAVMMAGMAVGGAVGQNIVGTMNSTMNGAVPPPVPIVVYNVAVDGQSTGPYELMVLKQMATLGQLLPDSLVWKAGMSEWIRADAVEELKCAFVVAPPIPGVE